MEIIQSFLFSISRAKLGVYEQRILVKIVEAAQSRVQGLAMGQNLRKLEHKFDNVKIEFPCKYVLDADSKHYNHVYSALRSLEGRIWEFYDSEKKIWRSSPLVYNCKLVSRSGMLSFYVARTVFDVILDFSKGYEIYDLQSALTLPSAQAVRFYALLNNQERPLTIAVDELKKMFGVADKYAQTADFIKKIVAPAKEQLDRSGLNTFTYARIKTGCKVTHITLFPVKVASLPDDDCIASRQQQTAYMAVRELMKDYAQFTEQEMRVHKSLIIRFTKLPDCVDLAYNICHKSGRAKVNPKGYIVQGLRAELKQRSNKVLI